ncbi:MAG: hypothetical protein WDZ76_08140 [Pseudohongiellaceae bacterium]
MLSVRQPSLPLAVALVALFVRGAPVAAQQPAQDLLPNTFSLGAAYSTGDYGEPIDTSILFFPVSYAYQAEKWGVQVSSYHLEMDGLGNVLVNVGGVTRAQGPVQEVSERGLGDTTARFTYRLDPWSATAPFIDVSVEVKLPTAEEAKGLGTGETDYAAQVDIYKPAGATTWFGTLGYRFRGESELFAGLENATFAQLGFTRPLAGSAQWSWGAFYDFREPASTFSKETHELFPFVTWRPSARWSLMSYGVWGATEDSADYLLGTQLSYSW